MRKPTYFSYIARRNKSSKSFFTIMLIFGVFCFASFVYFLVINSTRNSVMSLLFILFIPLIYALEMWLKVRFPSPIIACVLFLAMGSILGAGYDLYTTVPCFDTILHTLSGFIFSCLGFGLMELMIGKPSDKKTFAACLLFGFAVSLAIGLVWELFEYAGTAWFGLDMQEDTVVNGFNSYLLSGTHHETFDVDGIVQTVIYLKNGQTVTLSGYLDLGLIDTIEDMAVCFFGAVAYLVLISVDWVKKKVLFNHFVPVLVDKAELSEEEYIPEPALADVAEATDITGGNANA